MRGAEFIRRIHDLAKRRGWPCRVDRKRGKGSHVMLYLGDHRTTVRDPKDELRTGTLHAMLRQLGLELEDIQ